MVLMVGKQIITRAWEVRIRRLRGMGGGSGRENYGEHAGLGQEELRGIEAEGLPNGVVEGVVVGVIVGVVVGVVNQCPNNSMVNIRRQRNDLNSSN